MSEDIEGQYGDAPPVFKLPDRLTPQEIQSLAVAIYKDQVFADIFVAEHDAGLIGSIFMPLMFMDQRELRAYIEGGFAHVYEYTREAGPRSINGYPIFMSCKFVHQDDLRAAYDSFIKIRDTIEPKGEG